MSTLEQFPWVKVNESTWFKESGYDDHVYCVNVIDGPDLELPANYYVIEQGSVFVTDEWLKRASSEPLSADDIETMSMLDKAQEIYNYMGMDRDAMGGESTVCIGKPSAEHDAQEHVHGNTKIENYIRDNYIYS